MGDLISAISRDPVARASVTTFFDALDTDPDELMVGWPTGTAEPIARASSTVLHTTQADTGVVAVFLFGGEARANTIAGVLSGYPALIIAECAPAANSMTIRAEYGTAQNDLNMDVLTAYKDHAINTLSRTNLTLRAAVLADDLATAAPQTGRIDFDIGFFNELVAGTLDPAQVTESDQTRWDKPDPLDPATGSTVRGYEIDPVTMGPTVNAWSTIVAPPIWVAVGALGSKTLKLTVGAVLQSAACTNPAQQLFMGKTVPAVTPNRDLILQYADVFERVGLNTYNLRQQVVTMLQRGVEIAPDVLKLLGIVASAVTPFVPEAAPIAGAADVAAAVASAIRDGVRSARSAGAPPAPKKKKKRGKRAMVYRP